MQRLDATELTWKFSRTSRTIGLLLHRDWRLCLRKVSACTPTILLSTIPLHSVRSGAALLSCVVELRCCVASHYKALHTTLFCYFKKYLLIRTALLGLSSHHRTAYCPSLSLHFSGALGNQHTPTLSHTRVFIAMALRLHAVALNFSSTPQESLFLFTTPMATASPRPRSSTTLTTVTKSGIRKFFIIWQFRPKVECEDEERVCLRVFKRSSADGVERTIEVS